MTCRENPAYWEWIKAEAVKIHSDGCTDAFEWSELCCYEHDLGYYYGRDTYHAFVCGWAAADKIGWMAVNNRFTGGLPWWLKYRWLAVSTAGWPLWQSDRKLRP